MSPDLSLQGLKVSLPKTRIYEQKCFSCLEGTYLPTPSLQVWLLWADSYEHQLAIQIHFHLFGASV